MEVYCKATGALGRGLILLAGLSLLTVSAPATRPGSAGSGTGTGDSPGIPFDLAQNRVVIPVRAGASGPIPLILDTGMPIDGIYVFHQEFAEQLGRTDGQEVRVGGAGSGEASTALLFDSTSVFVGDVEFPNRLVVVSRSPGTQDLPRGGVIGKTLLFGHAVELDYDNRILRLHPSSHVPDSTWTRIDLELRKDIPWLRVELSVNGEPERELEVYIDLASRESLELLIRPDMKVPLPDVLTEERSVGVGLSGEVFGRSGKVAALRVADFAFEHVPAEFLDAGNRSKQEGADGILGSGLFRRFHVIFNLDRARLYLKPNSSFTEGLGDPGAEN